MKLGTETNSTTNYLMSGTKGQPVPEVGMGATILMWTDRCAATITQVDRFKSGDRKGQICAVWVKRDKAIRTDDNGMSETQAYRYIGQPDAIPERFKVTKTGAFKGDGGQLRIGDRQEYRDYSF